MPDQLPGVFQLLQQQVIAGHCALTGRGAATLERAATFSNCPKVALLSCCDTKHPYCIHQQQQPSIRGLYPKVLCTACLSLPCFLCHITAPHSSSTCVAACCCDWSWRLAETPSSTITAVPDTDIKHSAPISLLSAWFDPCCCCRLG